MIIGVINLKGGSGKTTISILIASLLAKAGKRVLLIDNDKPQYSSSLWNNARKGPKLFDVIRTGDKIKSEVILQARKYDYVIIDAPPRIGSNSLEIMEVSDLCVIPLAPSALDLWATSDIISISKEHIKKAVFLLNRVTPNSRLAREVRELITAEGHTVLKTSLGFRVAFAETLGEGKAIFEADPRGSATREAKALVNEILNHV